jgi:antitoxin MazE
MRVAKWGNSLAVRLPAAVVNALKLKEGDQIEIRVAGKRRLGVARDPMRRWALEEMERLSVPFPPDFKFNREELYERGQR